MRKTYAPFSAERYHSASQFRAAASHLSWNGEG